MKKLIVFLNMWLIAILVNAQNYPPSAVVAAEYFIDTDPGVGNATQISLTQEGLNSLNIPVPNNLNIGVHLLGVRIKNADNNWSLFQNRSFYVVERRPSTNPIIAAEYFIDTDPGAGNGTPISIQAGESVRKSFTVDIPNTLTIGNHLFSVRIKDNTNRWSLMQVVVLDVRVPSPLCDDEIVLISPTDDINAGTITKQTNNIIKASNKISGSANVTLRSKKSIVLEPQNGSFEIQSGSVFKTEIGGCNSY